MNTIAWEDHHAIVDALYRFGAGQDLRDRALFASSFAADATLDFTQPAARLGRTVDLMRGREAIADTIFTVLAPLVTTHTVTNPRVVLDGESAALWALVEAQHVDRADPARRLLLKNFYEVRLRRENGAWKIAHLRIENAWFEGDPAVLLG